MRNCLHAPPLRWHLWTRRLHSPPSHPAKQRIVVIGSGWGGYSFLKDIDYSKYDVRVISPVNHFLFTPLLPSTAVGTLDCHVIQEPVRTIRGIAGYYQAKAKHIDLSERHVTALDIFKEQAVTLGYDYLILACGLKTGTFGIPGVHEGRELYFLKHLQHSSRLRQRILECFERASRAQDDGARRTLLTFVVVGGGPTSVEFVGELEDFLADDVSRWCATARCHSEPRAKCNSSACRYPELSGSVSVYLIEAAPHILNSFDAALSTLIRSQLSRRRVIVRTSVSVTSFDAGSKLVHLSDGSSISSACVVWNAGLQPVKLMTEGLAPLCKGAGGRIVVDDQLRVAAPESGGRVFAIGDCAIDPNKPCPPIAQAAKQQGRHLARAFNAAPAACAENDGACVQVDAFTLRHMGSMVTWGGFKGAVDLHAWVKAATSAISGLWLELPRT